MSGCRYCCQEHRGQRLAIGLIQVAVAAAAVIVFAPDAWPWWKDLLAGAILTGLFPD